MPATSARIDAGRVWSRRRRRWYAIAVAFLSVAPAAVQADSGWLLIYYRQMGNNLNGDRRTMENHLFLENGNKAINVGVTNQSRPNEALFGYTDADGHNRINPLDEGNCAYDARIWQPGVPTDQTPTFYFQDPPHNKFYSYVTQWLYVSDTSRVTAHPTQPVYHYDLVNGLNQVNKHCKDAGFVLTEPSGASTDEYSLSGSTNYQAQTFVVPANVNRIISVQSFLARAWGEPAFYYYASIHQGSPTGPQIGPTKTSPQHHSVNFREEAVCWGLQDVPVTPGQTYALRLTPVDGQGTNVYATNNNNYANGSLYNGTTQVSGRDMIAVVVGVWYDTTPSHLNRSPASFTRSVVRKSNLPDDTFTVSNSGPGVMGYTISDDVGWLSVNPPEGSSAGESDTINIIYGTAGLAIGSYSGTITIDAPDADNTPQTISINLSMTAPAFAPCDFDTDSDVDQADFGVFQDCYSGSGTAQNAPECAGARLDADEDVDQDDFSRFVLCFAGSNLPVIATCAD